jgi:hypothetical protein
MCTSHTSDDNDDRLRARATTPIGDLGLGVPAGQLDLGFHDRFRRVPAEEDVPQEGEVSTASSSSDSGIQDGCGGAGPDNEKGKLVKWCLHCATMSSL